MMTCYARVVDSLDSINDSLAECFGRSGVARILWRLSALGHSGLDGLNDDLCTVIGTAAIGRNVIGPIFGAIFRNEVLRSPTQLCDIHSSNRSEDIAAAQRFNCFGKGAGLGTITSNERGVFQRRHLHHLLANDGTTG